MRHDPLYRFHDSFKVWKASWGPANEDPQAKRRKKEREKGGDGRKRGSEAIKDETFTKISVSWKGSVIESSDGSSAPDCVLTETVDKQKKKRNLWKEWPFWGWKVFFLYMRGVVKNLANHTLFCDGSVLSSRQWAEITPKCKLSRCLEKCAQNQKRHKNTEAKKALWSVRVLRSRSMSPHLAGERALRAACATLVASKRMKEHCNGWKASCMLKRPDWWLAITHLPLFISLNVLVTQTACLRCHKAPWQQRTRYIYLISTVNVSLREGRLIYYLKRF